MSTTNESKNSAVVTGTRKYDVTFWDDDIATWDSSFSWDSRGIVSTNETKNSAVVTNQTKN